MHIFISAGEPSGDLHGANLARSLSNFSPSIELSGFGGQLMRSAGVDIRYPLAEHAVMGFVNVLKVVPAMSELLERTVAEFHRRRPDAVVLIDYPGFHWWLAARAKSLEIPVISFVPPQVWAWASHRVARIRKNFDHVLCSLPFEEKWFHDRGVRNARYIGHPYFDELPRQRLHNDFIRVQRSMRRPIVALLPGSRGHEVRQNLSTLIGAARAIHAQRSDVRFLIPCFRQDQRDWIAQRFEGESLPAEALIHSTAEAIELADACIAVSGSVGLELLYRLKPTVVIYRTNRLYLRLTNFFKNVPYISIVNLLADKELYPEFLTHRDNIAGPTSHILRWLNDADSRNQLIAELQQLRDQVAAPGACDRAAKYIFDVCGQSAKIAA